MKTSSKIIKDAVKEHIENTTGPIYDILKPKKTISEKHKSFVALGVSANVVKYSTGIECRHEIIFSVYKDDLQKLDLNSGNVNDVRMDSYMFTISAVANRVLEDTKAISLGSIELRDPTKDTEIESFLLSTPNYFSKASHKFTKVKPHVILAWDIPITQTENKYIDNNGHKAFVSLFGKQDPDLLSFTRKVLDLPRRTKKISFVDKLLSNPVLNYVTER